MAIKVKLNEPDKITVSLTEKSKAEEVIELKARKSLSGDILIYDHSEIDIVVMPDKKKILTFAKEYFGDSVYEAQDRLFNFLRKRGVIQYDSIAGGNIYSSMEASLQESEEYNSVQHALLAIARFIDVEKPHMEFEEAFEEQEEDRLNSPAPGEYTEYDPERHSEKKGSINPGHFPYGIQHAAVYRMEE
tara:strand:- start:517 stop:1083 length:567 start_codon:yes stop_codon:yes gene_type:complete